MEQATSRILQKPSPSFNTCLFWIRSGRKCRISARYRSLAFQSLFILDSVWKICHILSTGSCVQVSILVYSGFGLEDGFTSLLVGLMCVSILVYSGFGLEAWTSYPFLLPHGCFNPCLFWIRSGSGKCQENTRNKAKFQSLFILGSVWKIVLGYKKQYQCNVSILVYSGFGLEVH